MVNFGPLRLRSVYQFGAQLQISMGFASRQRYCTASSSGRQPHFAALNRGRHLCLAGRPSRWALAYISSIGLILQLFLVPRYFWSSVCTAEQAVTYLHRKYYLDVIHFEILTIIIYYSRPRITGDCYFLVVLFLFFSSTDFWTSLCRFSRKFTT